MKKDSESLSEKLQEIISEAEAITSEITDPEIRRVAFDRVLQYLLQNNYSTDLPKKTTDNKIKVKVKAKKDSTAKAGTKTWLEELIEEDFFKNPTSSKNILEALDERGHILKSTDITFALALLVKEKKLRRRKMAVEGGKLQLHWYNW